MQEQLNILTICIMTQINSFRNRYHMKWTILCHFRYNQNKICNERGESITDLCISSRLRILNGRKTGDSICYLTCHKYNGSSVVD